MDRAHRRHESDTAVLAQLADAVAQIGDVTDDFERQDLAGAFDGA
jgi:hypothetical protein